MAAIQCPKCSTAMVGTQEGGIKLDKCPKCGTVWFDRTELSATVAHLAKGASLGWGNRVVEETDKPWVCPRDRSPTLVTYSLGDAKFRRCTKCRGSAVEPGEMDKLVAHASGSLAVIISEIFGH